MSNKRGSTSQKTFMIESLESFQLRKKVEKALCIETPPYEQWSNIDTFNREMKRLYTVLILKTVNEAYFMKTQVNNYLCMLEETCNTQYINGLR